MTLRIAHLTSVHPAQDVRIFHREAVTLARAGHDVSVVAPATADAVIAGVRIVAIPRPKNRRERVSRTLLQLYRAAIALHADVYHIHDPELLPVGILLKIRGHHVVYDAHEDYALQMRSKAWIPTSLRPLVSGAARIVERIAAAAFDAVVVATPPIGRSFPEGRTWIVQNYPDPRELQLAASQPYEDRPDLAVYLGGLADVRGAREMVEAIGMVPERLAVRLGLAGEFYPSSLRDELAELPGWARVDHFGTLPREGVDRLLADARVGIVVLRPLPNYVESYPTKLFEYMLAGMPVVVSNFALWRKMVVETKCGLAVDPSDPRQLADALTWLFEHREQAAEMGRRGRELVRERYSWEREAAKLLRLYGSLERNPSESVPTR